MHSVPAENGRGVDEGGGSFSSDLAASMSVWKAEPLLPLLTLILAVAIEVPTALSHARSHPVVGSRPPIPWTLLSLAGTLVMLGWLGTQRIWYLRAFRGESMNGRELAPMTYAFLGRFLALGLLVLIPMGAVFVPLAIARPPSFGVYLAMVTVLVDVVLTFVTPALAFTTAGALEAIGLGWHFLTEQWPKCAWYAMTPPLALVVINRALPFRSVGFWPSVVMGVTGWLLALWLKGAVAAYYLRYRRVTDDGSAWEGTSSARSPRTER